MTDEIDQLDQVIDDMDECDQLDRQLMDQIGPIFTPAWLAIRSRHPELPDRVAFTFYPTMYGRENMRRHMANVLVPGRYRDFRDGVATEPVKVELTRSGLRPAVTGQPDRTFATLLHEAAHVIEWVRHGQVSNHRRRFAAIASELGLATAMNVPDYPSFENMRRRHPYLSEVCIYDRMQDYCLRNAWWSTIGTGDMEAIYHRAIAELATDLHPWSRVLG